MHICIRWNVEAFKFDFEIEQVDSFRNLIRNLPKCLIFDILYSPMKGY